jgi:hypothetical protein
MCRLQLANKLNNLNTDFKFYSTPERFNHLKVEVESVKKVAQVSDR